MSPYAVIPIVMQARAALGWSQRDLGQKLHASMRTASRWETRRATMMPSQIERLAAFVYPVRPDLAEQLAAHVGKTLTSLGLAPPAPPAPPPAEPTPRDRALTTADRLDCILCSVADAAGVAPKAVKPLVLLTIRRAIELGVDLEELLCVGEASADPAATGDAK